jgi:uncharacterized protein
MQVQINKQYPVASTLAQAWAVLSDIHATAACMPGAQITAQLDATHYQGTVKTRIGPASMLFNGEIEVLELDASAHRLRMLGKGADRGGSAAQMELAARLEPGSDAGACMLIGEATVTVSGKLAQIGNRLIVPVSDALLAQFADNFNAAASAVAAASANAALPAKAGAGDSPAQTPEAMALPYAPARAAAAPMGVVARADRPPMATAPKPRELNALSLLWQVFKAWLAGLLRRSRR